MKKIKNVMLLALGSITVMAIALTSCKKDSPAPATAPTVTTIAPASDTIGQQITITGTGFTNAATVTVGGVAATGFVFTSATSIKVNVPTVTLGTNAVIVTVGSLHSTASNITVAAPAPTSNSIETAHLVAHWTFDTDSKEVGSSIAALSGGNYNVGTVVYTNPGVIGNCATFTNGALVFPPIPALDIDTALESYSVSMWIKLPHDGSHWNSIFQLNSNAYTDLFGIIGIQALNQYSNDTLALQIDQTQIDNNGVHVGGFGCGGCFNGGGINLGNPLVYAANASAWTLLTTTYDGNGSNEKLKVYANGVILDSMTLTTVDKSLASTQSTFRIVPGGGPGLPAPAAWANSVTIGTFNWSDFPIYSLTDGYSNTSATAASRSGYMSNGITGSIDDIRVFNTVLTQADVTNLFTYGSAGH